jgi:hypothetical protein
LRAPFIALSPSADSSLREKENFWEHIKCAWGVIGLGMDHCVKMVAAIAANGVCVVDESFITFFQRFCGRREHHAETSLYAYAFDRCSPKNRPYSS